MTESERRYEMEIEIDAPRDAVWRALVEAREIERWFAPTASSDERAGGRLEWRWGDQCVWEQTIEALQPGRHLRTRYASGVPDGRGGRRPLFVDFHLHGDRGTTTLRLVHSGFGPEAEFDAEYDGIRGGWPVELRSLRLYLERHRGRDRQIAWAKRSVALPPDAAWRQLGTALAVAGLPALAEGGAYELDVPGAGVIRGRALFAPSAREFSGTADNLGEGWFRVHCEHWAGATQVWLWLALYGAPPAQVPAFQRAFEQVLAGSFGDVPVAAERSA